MQRAVALMLLVVAAAIAAVPTPEIDRETGLLKTDPMLRQLAKSAPPVEPAYVEWLQHNSGGMLADLDAQWDPQVRLTTNTVTDYTNTVSNYGHQVVVDPSGRVHVVWMSYQTPVGSYTPQVYYKRFYPGSGWTSDTCISADLATSGYSWYPNIACDSSGNIHVVWQTYIATSSPVQHLPYYKRCIPTGSGNGGWDATSTLLGPSGMTVTHSQLYPCVATTPNGNVHVVWYHFQSAMGYVLRYRERLSSGVWQPQIAIDSGTTTYWYMWNPSVAGSRDNNVHVSFYGRLTAQGGSYYYPFYKGRFGTTWSAWQNVTGLVGYNVGGNAIAVNPTNNRVHLAWIGYGASLSIYRVMHKARLGTAAADTWQSVSDTINPGEAQWQYGRPSLAFTRNGLGHCVWYGYSPASQSYYQIRYSERAINGAWSAPLDLTTGNFWRYYPSINNGGNGADSNAVHVVWSSNDPGNYEIYYMKGRPPAPNDIGVARIVAPAGIAGSGAQQPAAWVKNYGTASQSGFGVKMDIGTTYSSTVTVTTALPPGDSVLVNNFSVWTPPGTGTYAVACSTRLTGDANTANDKRTGSVMVVDWVEDFEASNGNYAPSGGWEYGTPGSGRPGARSGTKCWGNKLSGQYANNAMDSLKSPTFVATQGNPTILFFHWLNCESYWDGGGVYYSTDGGSSWTLLYPDTTGGRRPYYGTLSTGHIGWSGAFPWELARFNVPVSNGTSFRMMWLFTSDASVTYDGGWMVDDVAGLGCRLPIDVGTTQILSPTGTVNYDTVITPQAVVRNFGAGNQTFNTRLHIGSFYADTVQITLAPNQIDTIEFDPWTARQVGSHAVVCSTMLGTDEIPGNNQQTGAVFVYLVDAAPTAILAPTGQIPQGTVVNPRVNVFNYGSQPASFTVALRIGTGYRATRLVVNLPANTGTTVTGFTNWTASTPGTYITRCSTYLTGDMRPSNDGIQGSVDVVYLDAAAVAIVAPTGTVVQNRVVTPRVRVRNNSSIAATFDARFTIDDGSDALVYDQTMSLTLDPDTEVETAYAVTWTAANVGSYLTQLRVILTGDAVPFNDVANGQFTVAPPYEEGWMEMTAVPGPVKDGGFLTRNDGDGKIYGGRGNKALDFYAYDPLSNTWLPLAPIPAGAKPPYKGSNGVADGGNYVYYYKGNKTYEFYRYDITGNTWEQLADVPGGTSGNPGKNSDLAYRDGFVYLLKGNKSDFMRYNVASAAWELLPDAPPGAKPKWDKGSWLVSDGNGLIYAHKGKYHEFYAFDIATLSWGPALSGMPFMGQLGKNKKSKDGSSAAYYNGAIYALKGGNTVEFWKYDIAGAAWTELDLMPEIGSTGKKKRVKAGGDIAESGDGAFFCMKGNKTTEFWRWYRPTVAGRRNVVERSGVMAEPTLKGFGFTLTPNPVKSGQAILSYSLPSAGAAKVTVFDMAGRAVTTLGLAGRTGTQALDLGNLGAGVYLVKLEASGYSTTTKLIVQ